MLGFHPISSMPISTISMTTLSMTESEATPYNRWAPRPLITLTIDAETDRYSTETREA